MGIFFTPNQIFTHHTTPSSQPLLPWKETKRKEEKSQARIHRIPHNNQQRSRLGNTCTGTKIHKRGDEKYNAKQHKGNQEYRSRKQHGIILLGSLISSGGLVSLSPPEDLNPSLLERRGIRSGCSPKGISSIAGWIPGRE